MICFPPNAEMGIGSTSALVAVDVHGARAAGSDAATELCPCHASNREYPRARGVEGSTSSLHIRPLIFSWFMEFPSFPSERRIARSNPAKVRKLQACASRRLTPSRNGAWLGHA